MEARIAQQTKNDRFWRDENGTFVPYVRLTDIERVKEKTSFGLAKEAIAINKKLEDFKAKIRQECQCIYDAVMKDAKPGKGGFTFYNFNATIKVEVQINERIDFDSLLIEKARQQLESFIGEAIKPQMAFVKDIVLEAFQKKDGQLNPNSVLGLKKYTSKITDNRWDEAMQLIDKSIHRPTSKTYFRVWVKNGHGEFESINLNFSSL
ncbi:DUF3164 family protein [Parasediminibacterium sp. JCM 36343]|uniref:DUF3164 family protein n=1 Tax=Parasediminibacterium sp. JCM 36343 TaxID=3374279 RepID=UPI00397BC279